MSPPAVHPDELESTLFVHARYGKSMLESIQGCCGGPISVALITPWGGPLSGFRRIQAMDKPNLLLVLGDQLSFANPVLQAAVPGDLVVLAEVREEACYVRHNRLKIALIFAAMRHFAEALRARGFAVHYFRYADGLPSLEAAVACVLQRNECAVLRVCQPGEYRLLAAMERWEERLGVRVETVPDSRFLCTHADFNAWADTQKQPRMEYFYRRMRQRYDLLLEEDGGPCGGRWNYDAANRKGWRDQVPVPARPVLEQDALTLAVLDEVATAFPENPGDLSRFCYAVTATQAQRQLDWFCEHALALFGTYQDGLAEESPWLFHSCVSMSINIGLLDPLAVCRQVEQAWRDGRCELAAAEGFIRQVLGWREYVRGIYWRYMPGYKTHNHFGAHRPLPQWFWSGNTDMRCLSRALHQSLELGYGHHIQRLMVIGNFALLAGLDVAAVCDWYLAVYVDAFEWVELPNTLGMALYADGGIMASKPYAASGKYLQRQGNHCAQCRYDPATITGEGACPYNALYWRFIDLHEAVLRGNGRMGLILNNWAKRPPPERTAILRWAEQTLQSRL